MAADQSRRLDRRRAVLAGSALLRGARRRDDGGAGTVKPRRLDHPHYYYLTAEVAMSTMEVSNEPATSTPVAAMSDLKLEVAVIPVSDVERAKRFYGNLGWRLDADFSVGDAFRVVQFTPPGSPCSIHFGKGVTPAAPGSSRNYLVVSDIEAARLELVGRGVVVGEVFHVAGPGQPPLSGPDPGRGSYATYAAFSDPDRNGWMLQEITTRFPGRGFSNLDVPTLTDLL